jgi:hypothetical protein
MVTNWKFNRRRAVKVVLEEELPSFKFEREISAALLAAYALWPTNPSRLRSAARNLARRITFCELSKAGAIEPRISSDLDLIRAKFAEPWYGEFHNSFVEPLGGLPRVLEARGSSSLEREALREWKDTSTRVRHDLVRFLVSVGQHDPKLVTRGNAIHYVSENIFGVADHYGMPLEGKRKQQYPENDPAEHRAIGQKRVERDWDKSPRTTVLLYAIQHTVRSLRSHEKDSEAIPDTWFFLLHPENVAAALRLYECIMQRLEAALPENNAVGKWRVFNVNTTFDDIAIPSFSKHDMQRLRTIKPR